MTPIELLVAIGDNKTALDALPDDLRNAVLAAKKEKEENDRRMSKAEREAQKKNDELARIRREKEAAERKELLCLGTWAENIPRNRRFALCERDWMRLREYSRRSFGKSQMVPCIELCAVDIVRGYTSPYFGYYCGDGEDPHQLRSWWKERLQPVIEAETEDSFLARISIDWNFFHIYDNPNELPFPFRTLTYEVGDDGNIKITGRSEAKTWQEHCADLKKEFAK